MMNSGLMIFFVAFAVPLYFGGGKVSLDISQQEALADENQALRRLSRNSEVHRML